MPLTIIKGPPNSGRTEQVRRRYLELLPKSPILVVPGVDDIFGWERRLTEDTGALVGGQIVHFKDLYSEILQLDSIPRPKSASELQRIHLMRQAIRGEWTEVAKRLDGQPGLVQSVLQLIDDFRSELVDPQTLAERIDTPELKHLAHLAGVFRRYAELLADRQLTDQPEEARAALTKVSSLWKDRPVMFAGFDEMTRVQLEMVGRLAFTVGVEVTVAVTHELDNPALALTNRLVADLTELAPPSGSIQVTETERDDEHRDHQQLLLDIEERFMRGRQKVGVDGKPVALLEPSEVLTVMKSTGVRNEAEAIAVEVAKLCASGIALEQIAIAIDAPAQNGRLLRDTLDRYGIPVTLEAETQARDTVTGQTLLNLLAAAGTGNSASAMLSYLRSPVGPARADIDQIEREARIAGLDSAREITAKVEEETGHLPRHWEVLTGALDRGEPVNELIAALAVETALAVLAADPATTPTSSTITETQTGTAIARACRDLASFGATEGTAPIFEALDSGAIKVWAVPAQGTVRIASPYSLRAKRVEYLFYASLQESGQVDAERAGPFLSVAERKLLSMSEFRDPEIQQRYLFYSTLTVPTERLWLSCRNSDETGKAEHPSPLIAAVEELFARDSDNRPRLFRGGRRGSEITFQPAEAPSSDELARSLAAVSGDPSATPAAAGVESEPAKLLSSRLDAARDAELRTEKLVDLSNEWILAALGERTVLAATDLEAYAGCPYRWFVERQLSPTPFEPDPDYLATGSLLHQSLDDIYAAHPGEIPRPATFGDWVQQVPGTVIRNAHVVGLGGDSVSHGALRSRAIQLITAHIKREAAWDDPRHLPFQLEAKIGTRDAEIPPVPMGRWSLKGKIDRIDLSPETPTEIEREAVVVDYKSGNIDNRTWKKATKERKFQIQLYMHAIREVLGVRPVAGVYIPLRAGSNQARGAYGPDVAGEMVDRGTSGEDKVESMDEFIATGIEMADQAAVAMMAGLLDHDPATCPNHFDHPAVPNRPSAEEEDTNGGGVR